eukprot:390442-Pleurochrysis_carterae.AAC.1
MYVRACSHVKGARACAWCACACAYACACARALAHLLDTQEVAVVAVAVSARGHDEFELWVDLVGLCLAKVPRHARAAEHHAREAPVERLSQREREPERKREARLNTSRVCAGRQQVAHKMATRAHAGWRWLSAVEGVG